MTRFDQQTTTEQAADWVTRIQSGEIDPRNCAELRAWLSENPEHRQKFESVLKVLERTDVLASMAPHTSAANHGARRKTQWLAAAAAATVAVGLGLWISFDSGQHLQTYKGERLLMTLEDGSSVHLNANSSVEIRFTRNERIATMQAGEILFDIDKDDPRPFLVRSRDVDVEVTGTSFQVTSYADDTSVSVLEGSVLVRPNAVGAMLASSSVGQSLQAGEQIRRENGVFSLPLNVDVSRAAAWRDGWLYVEDRPFRELVDRLNRQFDGRIDIADDELARSEVSVAIRFGQRAETLSQLELLLSIRFEELPGERRVVHARP